MATVSMKALLETGVHFGHRTRKWNPKMKPYIFTERNGIHILDLHQTLQAINKNYDLVRNVVSEGGSILFVGTKRQAQDTIAREATRCGMPYVNERWLGGTLTNWRTIRQRIDYLKNLEARRERGEFELLTKKEALTLNRQIEKLNMRLGGIREMRGLPGLLFIVDVRREYTAVHEANILRIPIVAMVDTNGDPDLIDHIIPANDDAIRAIKLVTGIIADAVLEGIGLRKDEEVEEFEGELRDYDLAPGYEEEEVADEAFLGEATLAKLKSGELDFKDAGEVVGEEVVEVFEEEEEVVVDSDELEEGEEVAYDLEEDEEVYDDVDEGEEDAYDLEEEEEVFDDVDEDEEDAYDLEEEEEVYDDVDEGEEDAYDLEEDEEVYDDVDEGEEDAYDLEEEEEVFDEADDLED